MADLDVQPKKRSGSILPWVLLGLGLLALLIFLARGCNNDTADANESGGVTTTDTSNAAAAATTATADAEQGWGDVNFNAPPVSYPEITDKNIDVRGTPNYGIYGIGESILFDEGKSTIRTQAEANLKQIAKSIGQRYTGPVRVYGHTDAVGSAGANKELAAQRAEAVRNWLVKNGNITEGNISVHAAGESQPTASNATESGRQQNRRVEIVARTGEGGTGVKNGATAGDSAAAQ